MLLTSEAVEVEVEVVGEEEDVVDMVGVEVVGEDGAP